MTTSCWKCNGFYPTDADQCSHCCASNANIDMTAANKESDDEKLIEHDWEFQDDSFDHAFGTEQVNYWQCSRCGATRQMESSDYGDPFEFD